jgi:plasmid stability protein
MAVSMMNESALIAPSRSVVSTSSTVKLREIEMLLELELPEEQVAALHARAAAEGLTLEAWLRSLIREYPSPPASTSPKEAVARILELQRSVKPDPDGWTVKDYINYGRP